MPPRGPETGGAAIEPGSSLPVGPLGAPNRQDAALAVIARQIAAMKDCILGALVVGSIAAGTADAASDIDLLVCAQPGRFRETWRRREELHVTGASVAWDKDPAEGSEIGTHRWITSDVIMVEALITAPGSGVRLARPWKVIVGDADVADQFRARPPIDRAEFDSTGAHPAELAYDNLKDVLRRHAR
jgi:Nucleotidyltransferase domain